MRTALLMLAAAAPTVLSAQIDVPTRQVVEEWRADATEFDLTSTNGIAVSRSGVVAVKQAEDSRIRFFFPDGSSQVFGREGSGPGEFRQLVKLGYVGDTLWANDWNLYRTTMIGPDLTLLRTMPDLRPGEITAGLPGEKPRLAFAFVDGVFGDGGRLLWVAATSGSARPPWIPDDATESSSAWIRVTAKGDLQGSLGYLQSSETIDCGGKGAGDPGLPRLPQPFCASSTFALSPNRRMLLTARPEYIDGSGPEVVVSIRGTRGEERYRRTLRLTPVRIPKAVADSVRQRYANNPRLKAMFPQLAEEIEIPDHFPPMGHVALGDDGWAWLELPDRTRLTTWLVLDQRGEPTHKVLLPSGVTPLVVSRNRFWGTAEDTDGLQSIVRMRVR